MVSRTTGKELAATLLDLGLLDRARLAQAIDSQTRLASEESQRKLAFLKHVAPFDSLRHEELEHLASDMEWREFKRGAVVIRQAAPGTHFYIVQSGLLKVCLHENGRETVLGFLGEADCFGEMALINKEMTTADVEAVEDTVCLVQGEQSFLRMVQAYPVFFRFFSQLLSRRMKSLYRDCLSENAGVGQIEPFLFRRKVTEMLSGEAPVCGEQTTIREAALKLLKGTAGSLVVIDDAGHPRGTIGMREVVESLLSAEERHEEAVASIMKRRFGSIEAQSYFFDALYEMVRQKADTLVVLDDGIVRGLITGIDLLKFRGLEMLSLLRNIDAASTASELGACKSEVETVLKGLMRDGALASQACRIVSELNDRIVRRVVQLAETSCGAAPCAYAWMGLGSEGRKEQTLLTDQDNALVYRGPSCTEIDEYFTRLSGIVVDGLAQAGFPLCKGMVMASNEKYRGDLEAWKSKCARWITTLGLDDKEIMDTLVFLDFRSNAGDRMLEDELRKHVSFLIDRHPSFLGTLGAYIVDVPVPLGFFKHFVVEKNGQHKNQLNIKTFGLVPLVTCVKLLAWKEAIPETNTLARISGLAARGVFSHDSAEFFEQALETFLTLRIRNNLSDWEQGREPDNYLDPGLLSTRQKQLLKEAFLAVSELQKLTKETLRIGSDPLRG